MKMIKPNPKSAGRPKKPITAAQYLRKVSERSKECAKCGKVKKLKEYYTNRAWQNELYRDCWCKVCTNNFCVDKTSLMEYCGKNKRIFNEQLWEKGLELSEKRLKKDPKYKSGDQLERDVMLFKGAIRHYLQVMHIGSGVVSKIDDESEGALELIAPLDVKKDPDQIIKPDEEKHYSLKWAGYFTTTELNYLETYFEGLQRDFKLENVAYMDYAKKVTKASLAADNAFAEMINCRPEERKEAEARYKTLQKIFDDLSQSAKFAEKTRTENDAVGLSNLGETIKKLENTGFLQTKITFEKDDIDLILEDYRWILSSIGEDF